MCVYVYSRGIDEREGGSWKLHTSILSLKEKTVFEVITYKHI